MAPPDQPSIESLSRRVTFLEGEIERAKARVDHLVEAHKALTIALLEIVASEDP